MKLKITFITLIFFIFNSLINAAVITTVEKAKKDRHETAVPNSSKNHSSRIKIQTPESDRILGVWTAQHNLGKVEIFKKDNLFFGKIVAVTRKNADGSPIIDTKNPNIVLRKASLLELEVLKNFAFAGGDVWKDGTIYDPKSGNTYTCKITYASANELRLRGYVLGIPLLGRTEVWTR